MAEWNPGRRPRDLRGRLAAALGTSESGVIAGALDDYAGVYDSVHDYVVTRLAERLPASLLWLVACCDRGLLRRGYEAGVVDLWTIPADDGRVLVFESKRR